MTASDHDREHQLLPSAAQAISNTPLLELSRRTGDLTRDLDGRILTKLDYLYSKTLLKKHQACDLDCTATIVKK